MTYNPNKSNEQREAEQEDIISDTDNVNRIPEEITPEDIEKQKQKVNVNSEMKHTDNLRNNQYVNPVQKAFDDTDKTLKELEQVDKEKVRHYCPNCGYNLEN